MDYIQITPAQQRLMLREVGAADIEDLLRQVPAEARCARPLNVPPALDEMSLREHLTALAAANRCASETACFLGFGAYDHYIPALVDRLAARGEFVTAYTPYQPEASQGALQAFFEFQTMVCQLTAMDISNASLYDGATAVAEAALMALNVAGRRRLIVSAGVHPHYRRVLRTYLADLPAEYVDLPLEGGLTAPAGAAGLIDADTAAVIVQSPNYLGIIEDVPGIVAAAHARGSLVIQAFNPVSLGLLRRPGETGVDIAAGEGQPLGIPLSFGGPYLGLFACKSQFMRRMPGRLVGQTIDAAGRRAFCLTLQTREQHIRREKATSNVCTNQGLMALRAAIYMAAMGPHGLRRVAELCHAKAAYLARRLAQRGAVLPFADLPFFNELVVRPSRPVADVLRDAADRGILAGVPLEQYDDRLDNCLLVAVTEKRSRAQIDALAETLA